MLAEEELTLLHVLGVVDEPLNGYYFHGHCEGKSGLRPRIDRWLTLHDVHDADQELVPAGDAGKGDFVRMLHYESWSGEEFVRKWVNILDSGSKLSFRPAREPTAVALRALVARGLPEKKLRAYLMTIFERTTEDDFETLLDLGLLEEVDPLAGTHRPTALTADQRRGLDQVLDAVRPENKWPFHTGRTASAMATTLATATERLTDPQLAGLARQAWTLPPELLSRAGSDQGSA